MRPLTREVQAALTAFLPRPRRLEVFPPFEPLAEHFPLSTRPAGDALQVRWLGTAGHVVQTATTCVLLDPFLTRPSLLATAFTPLVPTPDAWWHRIPARVDAVVLGHSHYDHILDAPAIARRTGAQLIGSETTANFARASGVPEAQVVSVPSAGASITVGDITIRFVPSLHGQFVAGRVPFPGEVRSRPTLPGRVWDYKMGGAFGIHLTTPGCTIYHNGSANLIDASIQGLQADVLLIGLAGRNSTVHYVERMTSALAPKLVIPTHFDSFFSPMERGVLLLPAIHLERFAGELARLLPSARFVTPTYDVTAAIPSRGDPRDMVFVRN